MATATYRRLTYKPEPYPVNCACLVCGGEIQEDSTVWLWQKEPESQAESTNPTPPISATASPIVYSHFACGNRTGNRLEKDE